MPLLKFLNALNVDDDLRYKIYHSRVITITDDEMLHEVMHPTPNCFEQRMIQPGDRFIIRYANQQQSYLYTYFEAHEYGFEVIGFSSVKENCIKTYHKAVELSLEINEAPRLLMNGLNDYITFLNESDQITLFEVWINMFVIITYGQNRLAA